MSSDNSTNAAPKQDVILLETLTDKARWLSRDDGLFYVADMPALALSLFLERRGGMSSSEASDLVELLAGISMDRSEWPRGEGPAPANEEEARNLHRAADLLDRFHGTGLELEQNAPPPEALTGK
jgi:hypothetical protein